MSAVNPKHPATCKCSSCSYAEAIDEMYAPIRYDQVPNGCWVACIAGLTSLSHNDLSAFVPRDVERAEKNPDYHNSVNRYLREHGWRLAYIGPDVPKGFAIGSGHGPRGHHHAVIVRGGEVWHDPHPSRDGIAQIDHFEVLIQLVRPARSESAKAGEP